MKFDVLRISSGSSSLVLSILMNENREILDGGFDRPELALCFVPMPKKMIRANLYSRYERLLVYDDNPMMHGFGESDESADSDGDERSSIVTHSRVEPSNWYIVNNEWSTGHVSRGANQSTNSHRHGNQRDKAEQWDSKSQECAELLRKKCRLGEVKKRRLRKCCMCCCKRTSGGSIAEDRSGERGALPRSSMRKPKADKGSPDDEKLPGERKIPDKRAKKAREREAKKMRAKRTAKSGTRQADWTSDETLSDAVTAGASADITKSCCYLCAQNSAAINAAARVVPRATEQLTRGIQVSGRPPVRTVQSSVRVRTCDRSTDCPRSSSHKRKKFKLKNFKGLSKYARKFLPAERTVACGSGTPIVKKRTRKTCGTKECRRYATDDL